MNHKSRRTAAAALFLLLLLIVPVSCADPASASAVRITPKDPLPPSRSESVTEAAAEPVTGTVTEALTEAVTEEPLTGTAAPGQDTDRADPSLPLSPDDPFLLLAESCCEDPVFSSFRARYRDPEHPEKALLAAVLAYLDALGEPIRETAPASGTVYYTEHGTVYHQRRDCGALAHAETVQSGSIGEAADAGKTRPCKRCGAPDETHP